MALTTLRTTGYPAESFDPSDPGVPAITPQGTAVDSTLVAEIIADGAENGITIVTVVPGVPIFPFTAAALGSDGTVGGPGGSPLSRQFGRDSFAGKGTVALSSADSGQPYTLTQVGAGAPAMTIVNGLLTNAATGVSAAAGYAQLPSPAPVTRMFADVAFGPQSTANGAVGLIAWKTDLSLGYPTIPDTDCHVVFGPAGFSWAIWRAGSIIYLSTPTWAPGFVWGVGVTRRVEWVSGNGWGAVKGPDGVTYRIVDARIGQTPGLFPTIENYQYAVNTDALASTAAWGFDAAIANYLSAGAVNLKPLDKDDAQVGLLALPAGATLTVTALIAAFTFCTRFVPSRNMTITKIAFDVQAADASNPACDVGILDGTGTRLGAMGATAGQLNSVGVKVQTLPAPVNLIAGNVYYAAFASAASGTPASVVQTLDYAYRIAGAALPAQRVGFVAGGVIPASAPALSAIVDTPALFLRES